MNDDLEIARMQADLQRLQSRASDLATELELLRFMSEDDGDDPLGGGVREPRTPKWGPPSLPARKAEPRETDVLKVLATV
jgi:hypothetical protein